MKRAWVVTAAIIYGWLLITTVSAAPPQQAQIEMTSPRPNAVLQGMVSIQGTANHPEFWKYEIHFGPGMNPPDNAWSVLLVREEPVVDGQLAVWDTNTVPDGTYSLRLRVVRSDGNWEDLVIRPVSVQNSQPLPTETPEVTETPEGTPTPLATLTPLATEPASTAEVGQPTVVLPPTVTPSPVSNGNDGGTTGDETDEVVGVVPTEPPVAPDIPGVPAITGSFNLDALVSACMFGAGLTLVLFVFVGLLFLTRRMLRRWL